MGTPGWTGQQRPPGPPPQPPRKPLDPAKREEVAQTLLYTVGSAILIAGLVLLVALVFPMSTSLLVYAFALGVTVVSLIFVLMGRTSRAGMVILLIAAALGLSAATASWDAVDVPPLMAVVMATLLAVVVAMAGRLSDTPSTLVWLAWLAVAVDLGSLDAFTSVLVGACCVLAMVGRGWPRHQLGVALPEPPEAVNRQGPLRDGMTLMGAFLLFLTLLLGRLDSVVEPLILIALAIAAQVVPVVASSRGWLFRAIPAVVALGAATKLVFSDMQNLSGIARVAAFMGCGAIMVGIAFLRQRRGPSPRTGGQPPQAPADPWKTNTLNR